MSVVILNNQQNFTDVEDPSRAYHYGVSQEDPIVISKDSQVALIAFKANWNREQFSINATNNKLYFRIGKSDDTAAAFIVKLNPATPCIVEPGIYTVEDFTKELAAAMNDTLYQNDRKWKITSTGISGDYIFRIEITTPELPAEALSELTTSALSNGEGALGGGVVNYQACPYSDVLVQGDADPLSIGYPSGVVARNEIFVQKSQEHGALNAARNANRDRCGAWDLQNQSLAGDVIVNPVGIEIDLTLTGGATMYDLYMYLDNPQNNSEAGAGPTNLRYTILGDPAGADMGFGTWTTQTGRIKLFIEDGQQAIDLHLTNIPAAGLTCSPVTNSTDPAVSNRGADTMDTWFIPAGLGVRADSWDAADDTGTVVYGDGGDPDLLAWSLNIELQNNSGHGAGEVFINSVNLNLYGYSDMDHASEYCWLQAIGSSTSVRHANQFAPTTMMNTPAYQSTSVSAQGGSFLLERLSGAAPQAESFSGFGGLIQQNLLNDSITAQIGGKFGGLQTFVGTELLRPDYLLANPGDPVHIKYAYGFYVANGGEYINNYECSFRQVFACWWDGAQMRFVHLNGIPLANYGLYDLSIQGAGDTTFIGPGDCWGITRNVEPVANETPIPNTSLSVSVNYNGTINLWYTQTVAGVTTRRAIHVYNLDAPEVGVAAVNLNTGLCYPARLPLVHSVCPVFRMRGASTSQVRPAKALNNLQNALGEVITPGWVNTDLPELVIHDNFGGIDGGDAGMQQADANIGGILGFYEYTAGGINHEAYLSTASLDWTTTTLPNGYWTSENDTGSSESKPGESIYIRINEFGGMRSYGRLNKNTSTAYRDAQVGIPVPVARNIANDETGKEAEISFVPPTPIYQKLFNQQDDHLHQLTVDLVDIYGNYLTQLTGETEITLHIK